MTNLSVYELKNITKAYQGKTVLKIDELSINQKEIFALIGPSGSGKSTLFRLLNFVESPDTGTIKLFDKTFKAGETPDLNIRRKVTTVFQTPLLMTSSVMQNVIYPLKIRKEKIDEERVEKVLSGLGLSELKKQRADKLSGGEAQRVSLARAIIFKPEIILLDEPTANLDPTNVKIIEDIILDYVKNEKATVIVVTHNVFQAKRLANRVGLLYKGEMVEENDKETFFENPASKITKDFLSGELIH
ncbi:Tungstate uptake system ATP-binding protein TupC [Natranaerofaba carboxydovora]|nr:Tungstate uptake system ATP-binding protein TupC [Natranaerofaba carboxydovora]